MRVLFLPLPGLLDPWYDDLRTAIGPAHELLLFNPVAPAEPQFAGVDVIVDQGGKVGTPELYDLGRRSGVRLWQVLGTGVDHMDVAACEARGVPVANTPGLFSAPALAEHALHLMLLLVKQYAQTQRNLRSQVFYLPVVGELAGMTLGLVGLGASGRELARRASVMGMRCIAIDPVPPPAEVVAELGVDSVGGTEDLDALLAASDVVSLHLPLMASTHHLIDARRLATMKSTAILINVARGPIVDEDALAEALETGRLGGAGLDAFGREPLDPESALFQLPNVVLTNHVAGVTTGTSRRRAEAVAVNVHRLARGEEPTFIVAAAAATRA